MTSRRCAGCKKPARTVSGWRKGRAEEFSKKGVLVGYEVRCVRESRRSKPQLICQECMGILVGHAAMVAEAEKQA